MKGFQESCPRQSGNEAKRRFLVNVGSNIIAVFVAILVGIWLTPYLMRHLGLEVYGDMDTADLEELLARAMFIAELYGRFTVAA